MIYRIKRILLFPFNYLFALFSPVRYARYCGVKIKGRTTIYGSSYRMFGTEPFLVTLHDNVFISVGAQFICHDGGVLPFRKDHPTLDLVSPIVINRNCFIGAGAIILRGVTIGENCVIGANAVVSKDIPPGSIAAGNPARVIRSTASYIERALENSLNIGNLSPDEKIAVYRRTFNL